MFPLLGTYPKKPQTLTQKNVCTSMLITMLFTTAKIWKQPKCLSINERIKKPMIHFPNGILLSRKKEGNLIFCDSMDGPGE